MASRIPLFLTRHPRFAGGLRWRVGRVSAGLLVCGAFGSLLSLAAGFAGVHGLSARRHENFLSVTLTAFRALVGQDSLPIEPGNHLHELLASVAAMVGVLVPALFVGVVFIRLFAIRAFTWRGAINVVTASRTQFPVHLDRFGDSNDAVLQVRFYKHLPRLEIFELRVRAYLRSESQADDGSLFRFTHELDILDAAGDLCEERVFPTCDDARPMTVNIPAGATLVGGRLAQLQGTELTGVRTNLLVLVTGTARGLNVEVSDGHVYDLSRDVQYGRFFTVHNSATVRTRRWRGWDRFEAVQDDDPAVGVPAQREPSP
ncbi:hypothetical protein Lfu02_80280 [Longispora fulva]|uniref:Uncharacterized protein n=1 Tax=Longispora fulva TaxID=619741 RepID=A0A8J7KLU4_9ACTN|nr:hypothetical protein [Longispora fulva]MBG6138381.1 hypothetical protein [Longispora fulva]GIG63656.1 hypothetical protein Lfu02_80280 [Longispora fulva]